MVYFETLTPVVDDRRQFAGFTKMLPGNSFNPRVVEVAHQHC
jgi:hypothetical protein